MVHRGGGGTSGGDASGTSGSSHQGSHQRALIASSTPGPGVRAIPAYEQRNQLWLMRFLREHLWIVPCSVLFCTILFLQYAPLPDADPPVELNAADKRYLSDIIVQEIHESLGHTASSASPGLTASQQQHQLLQQKSAKDYRRLWSKVKALPDSEMLRIVVTGGAGFVGSHLVDRLMKEGHQVCDEI